MARNEKLLKKAYGHYVQISTPEEMKQLCEEMRQHQRTLRTQRELDEHDDDEELRVAARIVRVSESKMMKEEMQTQRMKLKTWTMHSTAQKSVVCILQKIR